MRSNSRRGDRLYVFRLSATSILQRYFEAVGDLPVVAVPVIL